MAKKINITLSQKSIDNAIREIRRYKNEVLNKTELFVQRLAEVGIPIVEENIEKGSAKIVGSTSDGRMDKVIGSDASHHTYIQLNQLGSIKTAKLIVQGEEILFIEFGAGIHFNAKPSPHPRGQLTGMTIGSYGMGQGNKDKWIFEENGRYFISYGTRATMPVYRASLEIRRKVVDIAREVFNT